jgi:hypothetical protein
MRVFLLVVLLIAAIHAERLRIPIGGALKPESNVVDLFVGKKVAYITAAGDNPVADAETYKFFFQKRGINAT